MTSTPRRIGTGLVAAAVALAGYDLTQRRSAIMRNYPLIGRLRYMLEHIGPELRQYIVTDNDQERPFTRDQRRWVYTTAKAENNKFGFGTDNDIDTPGYLLLRQSPFPVDLYGDEVAVRKVVGAWRKRPGAFTPGSVVNVAAMSFGSLSGPAIEALNRGATDAGCLHNTGEGGISSHHLKGGDLVWQLGTAYFGARDADGQFDLDKVVATVERHPVRAIEVKLSQGAKPGMGGLLPAAKVSGEIAEIRGVEPGVTVASPGRHPEFDDVPGLVDFVERIAAATGLPVGIKSAVGDAAFWSELAAHMATTGRGPDFVTVDGGEGGTGAAPLAFSDHVALPFVQAFPTVYKAFAREGLHHGVAFFGGGKLGFPISAVFALAMGCDGVNVAREAMLAIGCIQAQRCHTDHCPTGVATQNAWLVRGLDPTLKSVRAGTYIKGLRAEMASLAGAAGVDHPSLVPLDSFEVVLDRFTTRSAAEVLGYEPGWGLPPGAVGS
ncbi:FMN-binding glutamate synthase family protein [Acidimicrobiia bacterium EGI L10123]|uniref:glutamate synthase-related protein n=1 Tax=Salinilacustrithrix flava TaxID=2957203 RepID=UPI003D7C2840|nr:FMN-binding glutamate synthase family protein [Acidimicrobiia bacterium EGI L10123]